MTTEAVVGAAEEEAARAVGAEATTNLANLISNLVAIMKSLSRRSGLLLVLINLFMNNRNPRKLQCSITNLNIRCKRPTLLLVKAATNLLLPVLELTSNLRNILSLLPGQFP
jgi:hypothetical protein